MRHQPVLLEETLRWLDARPGRLVVDGTLGDGGHAEAILARTAPDGRLVGLDRDPDALRVGGERLARFGARVRLAHASFRDLAKVLGALGAPRVDGVLLDLGVSSRQLDQPERGFRFARSSAAETALDMRMDPTQGETAAARLARASEAELGALAEGLGAAVDALAPGGRLCVIAYHSLEDRLVKQRIASEERPCICPSAAPVCTCGRRPRLVRLTRKAVRPSAAEISANPRARSARLRAAEKLPEAA